MNDKLEQEIHTFISIMEGDVLPFQVQKLCDFAYRLVPHSSAVELPEGKTTALTLMAITHGNELAGIGVLNRTLRVISQQGYQLPFPINVALGNVAGARQNKRFIERDLNRSFGREVGDSLEDYRARELEHFLKETCYLVDFHQTIEPSVRPFFIFPYTKSGFELARHLSKDIPVVTHWGGGFSKDGACSDEYVNKNGGVGISIELGQKGFDVYQECVGLQVALNSIQVVHTYFQNKLLEVEEETAEIYTWSEVIPFPEGDASLDKGWYNFQWVEAGQKIGSENGRDLRVSVSGPILFPKYLSKDSGGIRPKEICRVMKKVKASDLGT